jgi:SPP1 gp7 family putative phage head morphogenesis protein
LQHYEITLPDGGLKTVPPDFFIHFMQSDPGNPYWGIGDLKAAGRTIDADNEAQDTQKVSMQNRGVPSGVFQFDETLTNEQYDDTVRRVRDKFLQKSKRGEPWVLGGGYKWTQMSLTPVEMDYIQSRTANKQDIAAAFGLDPWWLGDKTSSTYNNVNEARKALYETTIIPLLEDIKGTLNQRIAPMYGDVTITYDISNVEALREDYGKKVEQATRLWAMGIPFREINKKLEMGFEEFPGWENGYLPFSVAPIGEAGQEEIQNVVTGEKTFDSEGLKVAEWRTVDSRRLAWERVLTKKFEPLYEQMGTEAASAVVGDVRENVLKVIDKQSDKWVKILSGAYFAIIEDFGNATADRLKVHNIVMEKKFDPFATYVRQWVSAMAVKKVTTILDTQKDAMRDLILQGIDDKLSNYEIAKSIRSFYTERASMYAMRVARTESVGAASFGQVSAAKEAGMGKKRWVSARDDRVRDAHVTMDGEEVDMDEIFSNGCEAPGIGDDPAQIINCRCALQFVR